jgi:hypothetical protein
MINMRNRSGTTLTELLVVMVVMGVVGASMTGLMVSQSRFFNDQEGQANARRVSRTPTTLLLSDLRAVEATNGVVSADANSFDVRVPYRTGVVCGESGGKLVVTMQPVDSMVLTNVSHTGWFWVDSIGGVHYQLGAAAPSGASGSASVCASNNVTAITNGNVVAFPITPTGANPGSAVTVYQRVQYTWGNSTTVPGTRALFRRVLTGGGSAEELVAPFDSTAVFRYHLVNGTITSTPSTMSEIRGIEFNLTGLNERNLTSGRTQQTPLVTSVFFENR